MFALLTEIAKQSGVIGLVIALMGGGFAFVVRTLWAQHMSAMERMQTQLDEANNRIHSLHDKRVADAEKARDMLLDHSAKMVIGLERVAILIDFAKGGR